MWWRGGHSDTALTEGTEVESSNSPFREFAGVLTQSTKKYCGGRVLGRQHPPRVDKVREIKIKMRERLAALVVVCLCFWGATAGRGMGRRGTLHAAYPRRADADPHKLKVLRKDTAFEASLRFCNELLSQA